MTNDSNKMNPSDSNMYRRIGGGVYTTPSGSHNNRISIFYNHSIPWGLATQFASIVTKTKTLKEQYKNSLQEVKDLYGSLSQKKFKGELEFSKEYQ